jgi:predicted RNA-binding protein with PUA-like domain
MRYFLAKTDPDSYSVEDFQREGKTIWDGVTNPQAVNVIRGMAKGDRVLIYHSGGESAIIGIADVTSPPRTDPRNPKSAVVPLRFRNRIDPPLTLEEVKLSGEFDDWALVRHARLSTMEVPGTFVEWLRERRPGVKL